MVRTDCVCSGAHCAAVGGFAALRMRPPRYGERAPCEGPFNRARALVHRGTPLTCHSEERSDVGISCRQLRFRRECPVIRPGTARLHPKGTSSRFALRAPRPLWGLAMTIRNPCMFGDAAQQPVTAKGLTKHRYRRNRFSRFIAGPVRAASAFPRLPRRFAPRNDNWGAGTVLTAACFLRRCCAGRGKPLPYNASSMPRPCEITCVHPASAG